MKTQSEDFINGMKIAYLVDRKANKVEEELKKLMMK